MPALHVGQLDAAGGQPPQPAVRQPQDPPGPAAGAGAGAVHAGDQRRQHRPLQDLRRRLLLRHP